MHPEPRLKYVCRTTSLPHCSAAHPLAQAGAAPASGAPPLACRWHGLGRASVCYSAQCSPALPLMLIKVVGDTRAAPGSGAAWLVCRALANPLTHRYNLPLNLIGYNGTCLPPRESEREWEGGVEREKKKRGDNLMACITPVAPTPHPSGASVAHTSAAAPLTAPL